MDETRARLAAAEDFLREAVYRSRERSSAARALASGACESSPAPGAGPGCGLGRPGSAELDLSARGAELFRELWPDGLPPVLQRRVRELASQWIGEQDAVDRRRNHLLRDFRSRHGFDRTKYTEEQSLALERDLARVNAEETDRRRAVALQLADLGARAHPSRAAGGEG